MEKINVELIEKYINEGRKKIVIVPFGLFGKRLKELLNRNYGITEQFCIDNFNYDLKAVFPMDKMPVVFKECDFLVAVTDINQRMKFEESLLKYVDSSQIINIISNSDDEDNNIYKSEDKVKMDFLCIGFAKCGTTSLQVFLENQNEIFLPKIKETHFLYKVTEDTHKIFKENYPKTKTDNKIIGGIEPGYFDKAERVRKYFGNDIKIIICMSNPVKALFSNFKMHMRNGTDNGQEYIKKFGEVSMDSFKEWAIHKRYKYMYSEYVNEYVQRFPKEQIRFIISEEMYQNPQKEMFGLQEFLGVPSDKIIECNEFPHSNKSNAVSKNIASAIVNGKLFELWDNESNMEYKMQIGSIREQIFEFTTMDFSEKIPEKIYKELLQYFIDDIEKTESIIGRSLKGIWY